jgi:hypothetical protein
MNYEVRFVYDDYKTYTVSIDKKELKKFFQCFVDGIPYFDDLEEAGFFVPKENLRCVYMLKQENQWEDPQSTQSLGQENDLKK